MDMNYFQMESAKTAIYPRHNLGVLYTVLGLTGEAGEVANKVKKVLRDKNGDFGELDKLAIMDELSDCLWYIAATLTEVGFTMNECAIHNLHKISERKKQREEHK